MRARIGEGALHFAGHSLAAAAAVRLAASGVALPFASATLFEPPIFPPREAPNYPEAIAQQERLIRSSARRQARWASPQALLDFLRPRGAFRGFDPEMLAAHCRACLESDGVGGFVLRCRPEVESAIFAAHRDADTWARLPLVRGPLHLVGGDPTAPNRDWVSGAMSGIAARLAEADLTVLPGAGHMMIFEQPSACGSLLFRRAALAMWCPHSDYARRALPVAPLPHHLEESEAVGGPSLRLSGLGSPAEPGLPQTALPAPGQSPLTGRHVF